MLAGCAALEPALCAQTIDARVRIIVTRAGAPKDKQTDSSGAVVWLTPALPSSNAAVAKPGHYRLIQKNKQFTPHLLVIPTASTVDFPNLDPFFHNVFSLFDGKRFDLGLYESGSSRAVHFDRDGVSYIFCNIHPEMSAIILTVSTPYYDVSAADGEVTIQHVPPGKYEFHLWIEGASVRDLRALEHEVLVTAADKDLGSEPIAVDFHDHAHKNKFGETYKAPVDAVY